MVKCIPICVLKRMVRTDKKPASISSHTSTKLGMLVVGHCLEEVLVMCFTTQRYYSSFPHAKYTYLQSAAQNPRRDRPH